MWCQQGRLTGRERLSRGRAAINWLPSPKPLPCLAFHAPIGTRAICGCRPALAAAGGVCYARGRLLNLRSLKTREDLEFFSSPSASKVAPMRSARSPATGSHRAYDLRRKAVVCAGVFLRPQLNAKSYFAGVSGVSPRSSASSAKTDAKVTIAAGFSPTKTIVFSAEISRRGFSRTQRPSFFQIGS